MPAHKKVDRQEFARLHADGLTQKELAAHFNIARSNVIAISNELGLSRRTHTATPQQIALWETCLNDGWSFREIANTHHVAEDTLTKYFPGRAWTAQQRADMNKTWRQFNSRDLTKKYARPQRKAA